MPIKWLEETGEERVVGKKGSSLSRAKESGLEVPRGFVITAPTFEDFVQERDLEERIQKILDRTDRNDLESVRRAENQIRSLIEDEEVPEEVREEIEEAYEKINMSEEVRSAGEEAVDLVGGQRETEFVAVRSSPTGARIPGAHHSELNVNGKDAVIDALKDCWASLYSSEALSMEEELGSIHSMAVIVQRMVEPEVSGSAYSSDPLGREETLVESVWGLGTGLSSGTVTPDRYLIDERGEVQSKEIANKGWKIVRDPTSGKNLKQRVSGNKRDSESLEDNRYSELVETVRKAENTLGGDVKVDFALARNGVQILDVEKTQASGGEGREREGVVRGIGASPGEVEGEVNVIYSDTDIEKIEDEEVVASVEAAERLIPILHRVSGIVSDEGGVSSNLSVLARELGVPAIVGTKNATDMLTRGETVTINGYTGTVFEGEKESAEVEVSQSSVGEAPLTATHVKALNSVSPDAEGAVIPDYINPRKAEQVAREYRPERVWIRTDPRGFDQPNLGVIGRREDEADGVVLESYGNVMRTPDLVTSGVSFLGIDVGSLEDDGGREALMNAVEKVGEEAEGAETAVLMDETDPGCVEKAVQSGIDTVAVPEHEVSRARRAVAKAERKFMLDRLREL
ncbi:MAG: PEP-utilizing enzyme [Candidatus Nanohaloarchaeota archaeon QJJ-7]|nr:PEP-utilizing enzyme [Candidatus Nanohaloarchaeota archaeon QJJ-7]